MNGRDNGMMKHYDDCADDPLLPQNVATQLNGPLSRGTGSGGGGSAGGRRPLRNGLVLTILFGVVLTAYTVYVRSPRYYDPEDYIGDVAAAEEKQGTGRRSGVSSRVPATHEPFHGLPTAAPRRQGSSAPGTVSTVPASGGGPVPSSNSGWTMTSRHSTVVSAGNTNYDSSTGRNTLPSTTGDAPFRLMDIPDFHYTLQSRPCEGPLPAGGVEAPAYDKGPFYVAFVHSAPTNVAKRRVVRETWGDPRVLDHRGLRMRLVFMLAQTSPENQKILEDESEKYGDIVQGTFVDAYRNLTYKHVMGLHWVSTYCPQAKFVLKTDDDIYVDVFHLTDLLWKDFMKNEHLVWCGEWRGARVLRSKSSKWYVSREEWAASTYSPYCSGWALVLTPAAAAKVFAASASFKYFWIDDVYVTGPMVDAAGLTRTRANAYYRWDAAPLDAWLGENSQVPTRPPCIVSPTQGNTDFVRKAWRKTLDYEYNVGFMQWTKLIQEH